MWKCQGELSICQLYCCCRIGIICVKARSKETSLRLVIKVKATSANGLRNHYSAAYRPTTRGFVTSNTLQYEKWQLQQLSVVTFVTAKRSPRLGSCRLFRLSSF